MAQRTYKEPHNFQTAHSYADKTGMILQLQEYLHIAEHGQQLPFASNQDGCLPDEMISNRRRGEV
jgi:hypothetical protein